MDVRRLADQHGRLLRTVLDVAGLVVLAFVVYSIHQQSPGLDARAYWAADAAQPYGATYETPGAYLYSPAFLQVLWPLRQLPFETFFAVWLVVNAAVLAWLVGPLVAALVVLPTTYSPVWVDLWFGNVMILTTAVVVIGFRWPAAWSFILLTKVTPGVGLVWFLVRREWRALALAAGTTAAIGLVSFAIAPGQWFEWVESLRANAAKPEVAAWEGPSWPIRLAAATLLIGVGAWLNAWWVMPVGLFLAQPVTWFIAFVLFLAWIALARRPQLQPARA